MTTAPDLAARLREATWPAHGEAASETFVKGLLRGERSAGDYARLASQHCVIYGALEAAVTECGRGLVAQLHDPALERVRAIEADLEALGGPHEPTAAALAYAERLAAVSDDPVRLAAHHYTRYLGDLSGGQHIGRALTRHFGEATTSFYRFAIDDLDAFKQRYRATITAAALGAEAEAALLEEAAHAYALSHAVHASLTDDTAAVAA